MHYTLQPRRSVGRELRNGRRLFVGGRGHRVCPRGLEKCWLARHHFMQNSSEREDIGVVTGGFPPNLFGRHVPDPSHHQAWLSDVSKRGLSTGEIVFIPHLGQSKIENLDTPIVRDEQVVGFEV